MSRRIKQGETELADGREVGMSRVIELGRFGQVYVGRRSEDAKAPLDVRRSDGEWSFTWRTLTVIVSPPSAARLAELRRNGPQLRVV